jgi:hypothetical protein
MNERLGELLMKRLRLVLFLLLSFTLTGCIQKYNVADEQSDAIAEYMAGMLLENDKDYEQDLIPMKDLEADNSDEASASSDESNDASAAENTATENNSDGNSVSNSDSTEDKDSYTLSEVIGKKNFNIEYKGYKLTDTYPENPESAYFTITPRDGYGLLVITFTVKNTSSKEKKFDLSNTDVKYQLDINVGTIYKPQFTLLENDLRYFDMTIKGGKTKEAVLVFEVTKDIDISNINLIISNADKSKILEIK